jgi:NAD(P)-dependent dehydrogenase (short-subunit alcohol dehydrogenase family)
MRRRKYSCSYRDSNSDFSAVQNVASSYTDCAIPVPSNTVLVYLTAHNFVYSIDGPVENWRKILDLNVLGLSMCTKEALQSMKERGVDDGHIIHINRFVRKITRD